MILRTSATLIFLLSAPLLLGANATNKQASKKDITVQNEAARTTSNAPHVPIATAQPRTSMPVPAVINTPAPAAASSPNTYSIGWYSINGGGAIGTTSPSYQMSSSIGQSAAGAASSANYSVGIGFWYGAAGGCSCPMQGDINGDLLIDVFDVIGIIGIAFSGDPDPQDPTCPITRGDVDNNGVTDVFDVIYLIATAFSGGANPIDPCGV